MSFTFLPFCSSQSRVSVELRLPSELQKRLLSLLSAQTEQLQVLSSAVLRETSPLSGQELNYIQESFGQLNSHAAALLLSQVCSHEHVFNYHKAYITSLPLDLVPELKENTEIRCRLVT